MVDWVPLDFVQVRFGFAQESFMGNPFRKALFMLAVVASFLLATAQADSHVRIVRLSYINGQVQIDRGNGGGYEQALPNMPVVEGLKVSTGSDGVAELEFEDGSTLRITPETEIEVRQLALEDSGATLSTVALLHGTAYVDFRKRKEDVFNLVLPTHELPLTHTVRLRAEVAEDEAEIAVFNGELDVTGFDQVVRLKKNETVTFDFSDQSHYVLAKDIEQAPYDDWSNEREKYRERYAASIDSSSNIPSYGIADLGYYGSSFDLPGYGWVWQPYGIGYGWDPFSSGYWNFYPSTGWIWCSYAPWGWYPYRYGSWSFAPGYGWVWSPGTVAGVGPWRPIPPVHGAPPGFRPPTRPIRPPVTAATSIIAVGTPPVHGPGNKIYDPSDPVLAVRKAGSDRPGSATSGTVSTFKPAASSFAGDNTRPSLPSSVRQLRQALNTQENQSALGVMRSDDSYSRQLHKDMERHAPAYSSGPPSVTGGAPAATENRNGHSGASSSSGSSSGRSNWHPSGSSSSWHGGGSAGGSSGGSMHSSGGGGSSMHSSGGGGSGSSHSSGGGGGGGGGGRHP